MEKYYKIAEGKVIETVTTIPEIMWERKGLLPYEKIIKKEAPIEVIGEEIDTTEKVVVDIQDKKVVETITKYEIAPTVEEIKTQEIEIARFECEMTISNNYSSLDQSLAALGILSETKIQEMKNFIQSEIDKRDLLIAEINSKISIEEIKTIESK